MRVRATSAALPAVCAAIIVVVLAPTFRPGFVLAYDMVFTPRQPLLPESLGLGAPLPRSVPADAVVAFLTAVLPGDLVQKLILGLTVFAAGLGAGRLVPTEATATRVIAAVAYAWNAYVAERLFIGHWALLVGYAGLPWAVAAGLRLRRDEPGGWARTVLACAPAALTPTGGILVTAAAVAAAGRRKAPVVLAVNLLLNAPWWLAGALRAGGARSDPAGVAAFAANGEGHSGPLVALLGLGGIWNADAVPASRHGALVPVAAALLIVGGAYGAVELARRWGGPPVRALAGLAIAGVLLALAGAVPGTGGGLRWAVARFSGAGLLRDGQKWAAWWALLAAVGSALAVEALVKRLPGRPAVLLGAVLLPVALLPDLAWGGLGRLVPVQYPADWPAVRHVLATDRGPGDVLVLPFQPYRRFAWNGDRPQLDPAPRFLPRTTVIDDTLRVGAVDVAGESPRATELQAALSAHAALGPHGIGWVLVEQGTPGPVEPAVVDGLVIVYTGQWLTLYRVPGQIAAPATGGAPRVPVFAADVAALAIIMAAMLRRWLPIGRLRSLRSSPSMQEGEVRADSGRRAGRRGGRRDPGRDRGIRDRGGERS
jgi:hypothetical protein